MFLRILPFLFLLCQIASGVGVSFSRSLDTPPPVDHDNNASEFISEKPLSSTEKKITLYKKDRHPSGTATIAAIVNGTPISVKDLHNKLKLVLKMPIEKLSPTEKSQFIHQVLNILIDELIKIQTTEKFSLKADPKDIETTIEHLEKQNNFPKNSFRKMLKTRGIPESTLITSIKADLLWRQYIGAWAGSSLEIDKKELKEIISPSLNNIQYHLAEIEIYVPEGGSEEKALEAMAKIQNGLKAKQPFMMLAHTQSHAPSAARGGDIGWINQDMIETELLEKLQHLQPGQITSPIRTEQGYKLILLIDKKDTNVLQPTLTARQIEVKISEKMAKDQKELDEKMEKLNKLVQTPSPCTEFDQLSDQIPDSQIHVYKTVRLNDLSPDLQTVLKDLETGVPSKGIFNPANNTIVFFLVCERAETPVEKTKSIEGVANQISNQRFMSISEQKLKEAKRVAS